MKKRVKITKAPAAKKHLGDQMGYGLYRGQGVRDFNAFYEPQDDPSDIRTIYPEVSREEANIEVEGRGPGKKGEKIIARDGMSIFDIVGKKHSQGGVPIKAEPGSYVVSDYIKAPKLLQAKMGFEVKSNRPKDNTWAKVLDSKVKTKEYNRLSEILKKAAEGEEVDRFELATAKHKFGVYKDYVSKAALGNELTKMMEGKEYQIPQIGIPALVKMFPEMAQQMMGGGQQEQAPQQQMPQQQMPTMGYGGYYPLPTAEVGQELDIFPWMKGKTTAGSTTPTGLSNAYNRSDDYLRTWSDVLGMSYDDLKKMGNKEVQSLIYDWSLQNDPNVINEMWQRYGLTNEGKKYKDLLALTKKIKDKRGRSVNTFKFDRPLTTEELKLLKKAYTDNYFGVRQLDPKKKDPEPGPEPKPQPDEELWFCNPDTGSVQQWMTPMAMSPNITYYKSRTEAETNCKPKDKEELPGEEAMWYCNPQTKTVQSITPSMKAKFPMMGVLNLTYYKTKEEAEKNCSSSSLTTSTTTSRFEPTTGRDIPRLPFEQDVLNLGTQMANMYGYRDVPPWLKRSGARYATPTFFSTDAQDAMLRSQARTNLEDQSLYAGPAQTLNARQAVANAAVIPAMMQNRMQTNMQNVGVDNQFEMYNNNIANEQARLDAAGANQLYNMNAKYIFNKDASRAKGRAAVTNAINKMLTHSGDQYLMNQWYPQYAFNPLDYRTYFHNGKGLKDEASATSDGNFQANLAAATQYADQLGLKGKEKNEAIMDYLDYSSGRISRNRRTNAPTNFSQYRLQDDGSQELMENGGPFIPVYFIGGQW